MWEDAHDRCDFEQTWGTTDIQKTGKMNWMKFFYCRKHDLGFCLKHENECILEKTCSENFIAHPKVEFCCICSGLLKKK